MELYQELRENWERLYWDEGYSKKIARDHANYESAEDDDQDFNPYRFVNASVYPVCFDFSHNGHLWGDGGRKKRLPLVHLESLSFTGDEYKLLRL